MLKNSKYTLTAFFLALTILLVGRFTHFLAQGTSSLELLPHQPHDRGMFLFVAAMLVALGCFADRNTRLRLANEEEKRRIFISAVDASQHILNNFLNNMLYFQQQAKDSRALDEQTLKLYDQVIHGAAEQLKKLGEISDISEQNIRDTIYPK